MDKSSTIPFPILGWNDRPAQRLELLTPRPSLLTISSDDLILWAIHATFRSFKQIFSHVFDWTS